MCITLKPWLWKKSKIVSGWNSLDKCSRSRPCISWDLKPVCIQTNSSNAISPGEINVVYKSMVYFLFFLCLKSWLKSKLFKIKNILGLPLPSSSFLQMATAEHNWQHHLDVRIENRHCIEICSADTTTKLKSPNYKACKVQCKR